MNEYKIIIKYKHKNYIINIVVAIKIVQIFKDQQLKSNTDGRTNVSSVNRFLFKDYFSCSKPMNWGLCMI